MIGGFTMLKNSSIFVISDLHMADKGFRDNFEIDNKREDKLLKFLDFVEQKNGELYILGDLFEFWQGNIGEIFIKRIKVLDRLSKMKVKYILGNHDGCLKALIGSNIFAHPFFKSLCLPFIMDINGKKFKFMHGHEYDPFNNTEKPGWGEIFTIFAGIQEDRNSGTMLPDGMLLEDYLTNFGEKAISLWNRFYNIYVIIRNLFNKSAQVSSSLVPQKYLKIKDNTSRLQEHLEQIRKDRLNECYNIAIIGHTHIAGSFENWYYNSGSWNWIDNEFIWIESCGKVSNYIWTNSGAKLKSNIITI
jgi:UDP-2,3-diacylglucosamine pyrophosphatase LpxH